MLLCAVHPNIIIFVGPLASNVEQKVFLQYAPCPCQPDFQYYDQARGALLKSIKAYSGCSNTEHRLGFCFQKNEGKLHIECIEEDTLNVTVTVNNFLSWT